MYINQSPQRCRWFRHESHGRSLVVEFHHENDHSAWNNCRYVFSIDSILSHSQWLLNVCFVLSGRPFKMKSKRYLDVCYRSETDEYHHALEIIPESNSSILSTITFGLFGSNGARRQSNPSVASTSVSSSPNPSISQSSISPAQMTALSNSLLSISPLVSSSNYESSSESRILAKSKCVFGELLFVQDRSFLIIVKPETFTPRSAALSPDKQKGM